MKAEQMDEIRKRDASRIKKITDDADTVVSKKMDTEAKKAQAYKDRIQELVDNKGLIFTSPSSKAETVALAKESLREYRRQFFMEDLIVQRLKDCQQRHDTFLHESSSKLFWDRNGWRFLYAIVKEEDIDKAAEMLPDIGLSIAERDAKIKEIDKEISALEEQLEKELKKL
jgi:hypothetical protein